MRVSLVRKIFYQAVFYVSLIAAWKFFAMLNLRLEVGFPPPEKVLDALVRGFADRTFLVGIAVSLRRIAIGYTIAVVAGVFVGLLIGRVRFLEETVGGFVLGLQSLPAVCWLPLAILWFGLTEAAILFIVFIGSILAIVIGTHDGVKNINRVYIQLGRNMGAKGSQMFRYVVLPAALPSILSGFKQAWVFAWRSLMAGEILFVSLGLGDLLNTARQMKDMSQLLAVMIVIIIIGIMIDGLVFGSLERRVKRMWGFEHPA
ncbi:MAG: sulfate ABC transporter permease [Omnitrophica bacterium RIFCSPHIGHO2_02_FULL_63_14]|nr:MAG: sulfate ABC transporter permease [Omnitrophica bacterium RIFCSPHIGHO2_02_FULL_63_14]